MRVPQQIIPLIVILLAVVAAFITARELFVPATFGDLGHYRADAVGENADHELVYAGYETCVDCHEDIYETKMNANHRNVACETCHGPAALHAEAPDEVFPDIPQGRDFCPLCHGYDPARPSGFPQVLTETHNPGKACMSCHESHNPELPYAPEDCSACHRSIARQKQVSHHIDVPCRQCHEVADGHTTDPRLVRALKPASKAVCGECHSRSAKGSRKIPRIDIDSHGERYMCWDCHYPHSPEANQ